jgi:hypothetical protein
MTLAEAYLMSGMTFICGLVIATIIALAIHELSPASKDWLVAFFTGAQPPRRK